MRPLRIESWNMENARPAAPIDRRNQKMFPTDAGNQKHRAADGGQQNRLAAVGFKKNQTEHDADDQRPEK